MRPFLLFHGIQIVMLCSGEKQTNCLRFPIKSNYQAFRGFNRKERMQRAQSFSLIFAFFPLFAVTYYA
jgi:hypothetical protein